MSDETTDDFLTVDEACDLLGVKKATLYAYVSRGMVDSYRQGIRRQRLYRRSQLEALLTVRPGTADQTADDDSALPPAADWVGER